MTVYVYVICTKDLKCKIGHSVGPIRRLASIQSCCPCELEMVHLICPKEEGSGPTLEGKLHRYYKKQDKHIHGEWFQLTEKDLEDIAGEWPDFLGEYEEPITPKIQITDEEFDILVQEAVSELDRQLALSPKEFVQEVWAKHAARVKEGYS